MYLRIVTNIRGFRQTQKPYPTQLAILIRSSSLKYKLENPVTLARQVQGRGAVPLALVWWRPTTSPTMEQLGSHPSFPQSGITEMNDLPMCPLLCVSKLPFSSHLFTQANPFIYDSSSQTAGHNPFGKPPSPKPLTL